MRYIMIKKAFIGVLSTLLFFAVVNTSAQDKKADVPKRISMGVVNGKAVSLPSPTYPPAAAAVNIRGSVNVAVVIDTDGSVISATAVSGHPLLRSASVEAAKSSKFSPVMLSGQPVQVSGVIIYNFSGASDWMSIGSKFGFAEIKGLNSSIVLVKGFENEQEQLNSLAKDSTDNQKVQIPTIAALIKTKLSPLDLWKFEFGAAKAKTLHSILQNKLSEKSDDADKNQILQNLQAFRDLVVNVPEGIDSDLAERISKIIAIADKGEITKEDKLSIMSYLR